MNKSSDTKEINDAQCVFGMFSSEYHNSYVVQPLSFLSATDVHSHRFFSQSRRSIPLAPTSIMFLPRPVH